MPEHPLLPILGSLRGAGSKQEPVPNSTRMDPKDTKNKVDSSVPAPETEHLSEKQKKALELSGELEHSQGLDREKIHDAAEDLGRSEDR